MNILTIFFILTCICLFKNYGTLVYTNLPRRRRIESSASSRLQFFPHPRCSCTPSRCCYSYGILIREPVARVTAMLTFFRRTCISQGVARVRLVVAHARRGHAVRDQLLGIRVASIAVVIIAAV